MEQATQIRLKWTIDSGVKQKFEQGEVEIYFDAWMITDYEHRWGETPFKFFMKGFINKYIHKSSEDEKFHRELVQDTAYIYARVREVLESYQGKKAIPVREEEVRRKMQEEMMDHK